jgi:hypothetical protein
VTKVELDLDDDGTYEVSGTDQWFRHSVTFSTAGAHLIRAR